jgi:hypothetical protein
MGDQDQRRATLRDCPEKEVSDFVPCDAVEIACRLVGDEDSGSIARARAMATRCCSPPESCAG